MTLTEQHTLLTDEEVESLIEKNIAKQKTTGASLLAAACLLVALFSSQIHSGVIAAIGLLIVAPVLMAMAIHKLSTTHLIDKQFRYQNSTNHATPEQLTTLHQVLQKNLTLDQQFKQHVTKSGNPPVRVRDVQFYISAATHKSIIS